MKKSQEVIGLSIISIRDGRELGKVKNLVINSEQGTVEFLIVENEEWQLGIKAIPFKLIEGIGEFAVTIEKSSSIIDLAEIPVANELLSKNIHINGTRIITRKGRLLGKVAEYYLDEEQGNIAAIVFAPKDGQDKQILPENVVLTYGKEILVVTEDADQAVVSRIEELEQNTVPENSVEAESDTLPEEDLSQSQVSPNSNPEAEETPAENFEDRQRPFLLGKKVTASIYDDEGNLMISEGQEVTDEVFDQIKALGRTKLIELTIKVND